MQNAGWSYKCWTSIDELKGDYFCANLYSDQARMLTDADVC